MTQRHQVRAAASLMFVPGAVLHLLPAAKFLNLNAMTGALVMALGTVAGVLLGWVYCRYGLLMAMHTHAVAGLLLYLGARGLMTVAF